MAKRPWVTPAEVKEYTESAMVRRREDSKLAIDITRAELYVISYTRNKFDDEEKSPEIPESVKLAVKLIAEMYAIAAMSDRSGTYKSETFDDYSYTLSDTDWKIDNLLLEPLLDEYILGRTAGVDVVMRMRKL